MPGESPLSQQLGTLWTDSTRKPDTWLLILPGVMLLARKSNRPNPIVPPARPRKQRITRRQKAQTNRMCREPSGGGGGHMLPMSSSGIPWRGWQPTGATTWLQCVDTNSIVLTKHSNAIHARLNMTPRHIFAPRNHARESVCVCTKLAKRGMP